MKDALTVTYANSLEITDETKAAISKLPASLRKLATDITTSNNKARIDAAAVISGISLQAAQLAKDTAKGIYTLVHSYDMKGTKDSPFKSWGDFAKAAWNKSGSWVTQNCGVGAILLNDNDEHAVMIASDFNFSQIAEMLPLCDDGKPDSRLTAAIDNGEISADMTAADIRKAVKEIRSDGVEDAGRKVDMLFPATGNRVDGAVMKQAALESNDERLAVKFNPEYKDHDGTDWRGVIYVKRDTLETEIMLYHAHKERKTTEPTVKHLDATDRLAISIREMPEKFRADIVREYRGNKDINYDKLCKLVGVSLVGVSAE